MAAKKTKKLAAVLIVMVVAVVAVIVGSLVSERINQARSTATLYEQQIRKLAQGAPREQDLIALRDGLKADLEARKAKFYAPGEMDFYSFGILTEKSLEALGIVVSRYQVVDVQGQKFIEYAASGPALAFTHFLQAASASNKYWSIPSMTVKVLDTVGKLDVVFRIGYETIDSKGL